jgi:hypothetical protein
MSKPAVTDEDIRAEECADLWEEIERVLGIPNARERMDAIEDLSLLDLMKKAVERRVKAMMERGDFQ